MRDEMNWRDVAIGTVICIGCVFGGYWAGGLADDHRIRTTATQPEKTP